MFIFQVYKRALAILWGERLVATVVAVAGFTTAAIQLIEPILFGKVIDALSNSGHPLPVLTLWATLGLVNVVVSVFVAIMADRLAHRRRLGVLGAVFERAITLPVSFHAEQGSGRVVRAILAGTDHLFGLWLSFLRDHLPGFVGLAVLVPAAISMNWRLALLLFAVAGVYVVGNAFVLRQTQFGQANVERYLQNLFGRVGDVIGNVTVVQSYTRYLQEAMALQELMGHVLRVQYPVLNWWGILNVITRVSATLTMVAILALGSVLAGRGEASVGEIVAFVGFSGLLINKLDQISGYLMHTLYQAPTLKAFFDLLDMDGGAMEQPGAQPLPAVRGEVVFENVTFRYPKTRKGVEGLNFRVEPGQTIALVGTSGSGKTTTLALLQRLYDPEAGRILIDGHDIRAATLASLRHHVAVVFQDAGLFNRSIADNILVGRPEATMEDVENAARMAEAHDFILSKPGGYNYVIGERGASLSGGERQRIAIARAILKQAPILIFDEATSALDNRTERKIQSALTTLRRDKTTFIIAHRLSTVVAADQILVFENGLIVEQGRIDDLTRADGHFAHLLRAGELVPGATPFAGPAGELHVQ